LRKTQNQRTSGFSFVQFLKTKEPSSSSSFRTPQRTSSFHGITDKEQAKKKFVKRLFDRFLDFATTAVIDQNQLLYSLRNTISYWNEFLVFRKPWLYVLNNYHEKHLSFGATSNTHPTLPRTTKGYGVQFSIPCPQTWPDTPSHFSLFGQYRS